MEEVDIRKANIEDGKIISTIIRESFKKQADLLRISEAEYPRYVAFETEEIAQSRVMKTEVMILFVKEIPTGTVGFYHKNDVGYIERLAVIPECRGNHYGELLLEYAETELFYRGCKQINISMVASFLRLKEYYENLGYRYNETVSFPAIPFEVAFLSKGKESLN